jgi:hypothetical protein
MSTSSSRRPSPAAIRRALDECLTLPDIDRALGWSAGTAAKYRQRPAPVGLPEPDATVGRTPVWFRATIERWQAERPGRGVGGGRPRGYSPARADLEAAERELAAAREGLVMVEHGADDGPTLARYEEALAARNAAREATS